MFNKFQELLSYGIPNSVILKIMNGVADEAFEKSHWAEMKEVTKWKKTWKISSSDLTVAWDRSPENFYLAYDGVDKDFLSGSCVNLYLVAMADVLTNLHFQSARDKDPFSKNYKTKSYKTAYRWSQNMAVTPALAIPFEGKISLLGMHRFHLAKWCGVDFIELLVLEEQRQDFLNIIPNAELVSFNMIV